MNCSDVVLFRGLKQHANISSATEEIVKHRLDHESKLNLALLISSSVVPTLTDEDEEGSDKGGAGGELFECHDIWEKFEPTASRESALL